MCTIVLMRSSAVLRRARLGVTGVFFSVGFGFAAWLVNIPAVEQRTGVSHATLGSLLLLLGLGGVIGMQVTGYLISRFGSKPIVVVTLAAFLVAVNLPVRMDSAVGLGVALVVFGLMNGSVDVAMNDQAVIVERDYQRPIMSAFHAFWSLGGAAGALVGAGTQAAGLSAMTTVLVCVVIAAVVGTVSVFQLLPSPRQEPAAPTKGKAKRNRLPVQVRRRLVGFAVLAFLLMLAEGVANDWAPLHAVEHLQRSEAAASLAYATFAVAMTVGRLTVDRVAGRRGPAFVVRYGSLAAAVGMLLVIVSPLYQVTLAGWAVFGLGLAGVVPQLFTAAGNISTTDQSVLLARVVGAGYVGQLAGPAVVGVVAGLVGLNLAFILPLLFCVVGVLLASIVTSPTSTDPTTQPVDGIDQSQPRFPTPYGNELN